jgi:hypothetical protein
VVPGTSVLVEVGPPDCRSDASLHDGQTDETGRYRAIVMRMGDYAQQCIRVWARPPQGSPFRASDTLQFTLPTPVAAGADSVRRDVALRAP